MGFSIKDFVAEAGVKFDIINLDEARKLSIQSGRGFIINESIFKRKKKNLNGIQSPKFGSSWDSQESIIDMYKCECGETRGRRHLNKVCSKCDTKVICREVDYGIFGWMVLENHRIIHPLWYQILETAFGADKLREMVKFDKETDINGNIVDNKDDEYKRLHPYGNIGIIEFEKNIIEILIYYKRRKKNRSELFDFIYRHLDDVFTSSIPVCSSALRPTFYTGEKLNYSKLDRKYNPIVSKVNKLNRTNSKIDMLDIGLKLYKTQMHLNELWLEIFKMIDQKEGFIKGDINGGRVDYSARNVVVPDATLRSNQVKLGYKCFMELYKQEIIGIAVKTLDITYNEALHRWNLAMFKFDPTFYNIMKFYIKKNKPAVIINRNPTKLNWLALWRHNEIIPL